MKDGMGQQTRESMKILEIEPIYGKYALEKEEFVCQRDGTVHRSQEAMDKYIKEMYADEITDQKFAKEFKEGKKKAS